MKRISDEQKRIEELQLSMKSDSQEQTTPDGHVEMTRNEIKQFTKAPNDKMSSSSKDEADTNRSAAAGVMSTSYPTASDFAQPASIMSQSAEEPFVLHKSTKKSEKLKASEKSRSNLVSNSTPAQSPSSTARTSAPSNGFLSSSQLSKRRVRTYTAVFICCCAIISLSHVLLSVTVKRREGTGVTFHS